MGLPIQAEGGVGFAGTMTAAVQVARLAEVLRAVPLPLGAELVLVDRNDKVVLRLADGNAGDVNPGDAVPPALMNLLPALPATGVDVDAETGRLVSATDERGASRLVALAPYVPGTEGTLRLAVSYDPASLPVAASAGGPASSMGLALGVGGLALALIVAFVGARVLLSRPLAQALASAASGSAGAGQGRSTGAAQPASAAARDNEALLALALETGNLAAWELDPATGTLNHSENFDGVFGYGRPVGRWTWRGFLRHILPEDRPAAEEAFRRLRAEPGSVAHEVRILPGRRRGAPRSAPPRHAPTRAGRQRPHLRRDGRRDGRDGGGARPHGTRRAHRGARAARGGGRRAVPPVPGRAEPPRAGDARHRAGHRRRNAARPARHRRPDPRRREDRVRGAPHRPGPLARGADARGRCQGADLSELVNLVLAPHAAGPAGARHIASGPALWLPAATAVPISVALHELATNAARHGALSQPKGSVAVTWRLEEVGPGHAPMLRLHWEERGGPQLEGPPRRKGFGLKLLETGLAPEIGGLVSVEFRPTGLVCEIEAPLKAAAPAVSEAV